jgi:glycine cleavage system aminomethyltransferase T
MTSFGKIRVEGRDAPPSSTCLRQRHGRAEPGRIVYTQMLNARGGIESDLTVTRLSETAFPAGGARRDAAARPRWLGGISAREFVTITDVTAAEAVLCVMGPNARSSDAGRAARTTSNEAHPFGTAREIEIGMGLARAHRVTYVGELGLGALCLTDQAAHVFEALAEAGSDHGLKLCGLHTLDLPHRKGLPPFRP